MEKEAPIHAMFSATHEPSRENVEHGSNEKEL